MARKKKENTQQIGTYRKKVSDFNNRVGTYRSKLQANYQKYMDLLKANQENRRNEYYQQVGQQTGQDLLRTAARVAGTPAKQTVTLDDVKQQAAQRASQNAAAALQGAAYKPVKANTQPAQDDIVSRFLQKKQQEDKELEKWNNFIQKETATPSPVPGNTPAATVTPTARPQARPTQSIQDIKATPAPTTNEPKEMETTVPMVTPGPREAQTGKPQTKTTQQPVGVTSTKQPEKELMQPTATPAPTANAATAENMKEQGKTQAVIPETTNTNKAKTGGGYLSPAGIYSILTDTSLKGFKTRTGKNKWDDSKSTIENLQTKYTASIDEVKKDLTRLINNGAYNAGTNPMLWNEKMLNVPTTKYKEIADESAKTAQEAKKQYWDLQTEDYADEVFSFYDSLLKKNENDILSGIDYTPDEKVNAANTLVELNNTTDERKAESERRIAEYYRYGYDPEITDQEEQRRNAFEWVTGDSYDERIIAMREADRKQMKVLLDSLIDNAKARTEYTEFEMMQDYSPAMDVADAFTELIPKAEKEQKNREIIQQYTDWAKGRGHSASYDPELHPAVVWTTNTEGDRIPQPQGNELDQAYYWINNPTAMGGMENSMKWAREEYFLNDEQRETFNMLYRDYKEKGTPIAKAYWDALKPKMNWFLQEYQKRLNQMTAEIPVVGAIDRGVGYSMQVLGGITGTIGTVLARLGNEDAQKSTSGWYIASKHVRDVREQQNQDIADAVENMTGSKTAGNIAKFSMNVVDSIGDNVMATGIAKHLTNGIVTNRTMNIIQAIMSSEATSNAMVSQLEAGRKPIEAARYALAVGTIEGITERASLERIIKPDARSMIKSFPKALGFIAKSAAAEGSEEGAADLAEMIMDGILSDIYDHRTELQQKYNVELRNLVNEGENYQDAARDATRNVLMEKAGDIGMSVLAGAISGAAFGAGRTVNAMISTRTEGGNIANRGRVQELIDVGLESPKTSEGYQMALDLQQRMEAGGKITNKEIGILKATIEAEASEVLEKARGQELSLPKIANSLNAIDSVNAIAGETRGAAGTDAGMKMASIDDEREAKGTKTEGARGVIHNGENESNFARLIGIRTVEVKKKDKRGKEHTEKVLKYVIEIDGKEIEADPHTVQSTDYRTAVLMNRIESTPGLYSPEFTYNVLSEMEKDKGNTAKVLAPLAESIRIAAFTGAEMPKTAMDPEIATRLYEASKQEFKDIRAEDVTKRNAKKPGTGTVWYKGAKLGTNEYAAKTEGLSKETKNMMGAAAQIAMRSGMDIWFVDKQDLEKEKESGRLRFKGNLAGLWGIEGYQADDFNGVVLNIEGKKLGTKGFFGQHHIMATFGHEFIHWLQRNSLEGYNNYQNFILEEQRKALGGQGALAEELIRIMDTQGVDLAGAISELVADSSDQIFANKKVIQHIQETNKELYNEIKGFVKNLIARIHHAITGMEGSASRAAQRMYRADINRMAELFNLAYDEATGKVIDAPAATETAEKAPSVQAAEGYVQAEYVGTGKTRTVQARITNPLTMKQGQFSWLPNQTAQSLLDSKEISLTPAQEAELRKVTEHEYEKYEEAWDHIADVLQEQGYDGIRMADGQYIALKNTQTAEEGETRLSQADSTEWKLVSQSDGQYYEVDQKTGKRTLLTGDDAEYVAAWKRGDFRTMEEILAKKIRENGAIPFKTPNSYSTPNHRWVANAIKQGNMTAIRQAAAEMATMVPDNAVLVPMPNHYGEVNADTDTMILAQEISRITGRPVVVALKGVERQSRQMDKGKPKSQQMQAEDLGFRQVEDIPEGMVPYFVDNVIASGLTAEAAHKALGNNGVTLAYAKSTRSANDGLKRANATFYDTNKQYGSYLIPLSERINMEKTGYEGVKFSQAEMDAEYEQAIEEGNTEKQQALVDAAAEKAMTDSKVRDASGKLLKMYHGTNATFNVFLREKIGSTGQFEGAGYNFTPYEGRASSYGKNVYAGYLKITKPLSSQKKTISVSKLAQLIRMADPTGDNIISNYARETRDYGSESFIRRESLTAARSIWDASDNDVDIYSFISAAGADASSLIDVFKDIGYDGLIHYDENGNIKTAVAFDSNQFKRADPVTYQDDGVTPIPLSERFNLEKPDIRYSQAAMEDATDPKQEELYNALEEANAKVKALRERVRTMKPEVDAWTERITEAFDNGTFDKIQEEYKEWEKGYVQLREELTEAERAYSQANQDFEDYIEQRDVAKEKAEIEESGLTEAEYRRKQAVKTFGTTSDFNEAGYLMPDGKMLDFSGKKHGGPRGTRSEDHRAIGQIYSSSQKQGGEAMLSFMRDGNIRVMASTPGIDIISTIEPTAEQYSQIRKMAQRFAGEEYFNIDFTDENGQVVDTLEYDGRVNPERIINDIKTFYRTGAAPQQSVVSQFHYSQAGESDIDVETWMETRSPGSFRTEDERIMWETWKRLRNDVRMVNFRIEEYKKQIRALEAKGENLTAEERDQLRGLRNKLEVKQVQLDRLEKELRKTTGTEGFATMMRDANLVIGDFMAGKTSEQVTAAVDTMTVAVERADKEMAQQEKALAKLAEEEPVKVVQKVLKNKGLKQMVQALRSNFSTTMSEKELSGRVAEIILKGLKGEDVTADIEALASDVVSRQRGYGNVEAEEALSALRGRTIVIGPGQQAELKANHLTLKDLRARTKGSGIKFVFGERSTLDTDAEELIAEVPALRGMLDNEKASLENFVGYVENLLSLKNGTAEENGVIQDDVSSFISNMITMMLNENLGGVSKAELIDKLKNGTGQIGTALAAVRRIRESLGTVKESGERAQTWTGVLRQDMDTALNYYDQVARLAARQERTQVRKTLIEQLRAENTRKLMQQQEKYEQMIKNDRTARQLANDNMTLRSKINTVVKRISRLMTEETDLKNIPEEAKPLARLLVKMFVDHDSNYRRVTFSDNKQLQRAAENIQGWEKLFGGFDYDHGLDWLVTGEGDTADTELRDAVEDALVDIETGLMEYRNAEGRGTVSLQDRKNALTKIQDAVAKIYNVIQARRYAEINGKRALVTDLALSARDDMQHSRFRGEWTGWLGRRIGTARRGVIYGNMTPVYFFKNLRNGTLSSLFRGYESAENKNGLAIARAQATMQKIAQETGYGTWDQERRYEIQLEKGGTVRLTLGEMMSLYATWQRELMNQSEINGPEKSFHLTLGGFITEPEQRGGVAGRQMQQQRPHRLTEGDMAKITAMMTPQQIEYVTRVVEYMTKEIGELGNEASMKMYGIRKFNEKWYFPFEVWRGVMSSKSTAGVQNAQQNAAAHQSFTKRRMNNARNALMIRDFTQTAARHIVAQINYNTFAPAIEWMQRVMNSKQMEGEDAESMTERNLWAMFQEVYGKDAYAYFKRFQQDMNGGATQQSKTFYDRLISTFRKSAVAGSLSVAAQQPLSYIRAAMEISPRWLVEALNPRYYRGSNAEMEKWSGVAVLKRMGKFDMGFGESAAQYIEPEARERGLRRAYNTVSDWTTALPELMDRVTWTRMWTAAKLEQAHLHPEMDQSSDEFMELVANRFNDIIRRTQVYDSTLVRSQNMRDKNPGLKMLTSFMAEPTLTANVLADAIINARENGGGRRLAMAAATYLLSAVAQAAVKGTMGAGRNPDKKKTWAENWWYRFMYNLISEANPASLVPGYSNIVSLLKDGELDDNAMAMIGKVFDAAKTGYQLVSGQKDDVYRGIEDSVALIAQLFTNIPAKNLMRDARAMYNFFTQPYAQRETSQGVLRYQTQDLINAGPELLGAINSWLGKEGYQTTVDAYAQRIYQAQKSGDEEAARLMSEYVTLAKSGAEDPEKALQSKLKSIAKKDKDASAEETMQYLQENGGSEQSVSTYIMDELKDGKIDAEEARKLLKQNEPDKSEDDIWWKVDRAEYAKENGTDTPGGYYYRLTDAVESNRAEEINKAVNDLKKHGVTDKQIKTKLSSWKQAYLEATGDEKRRIRDALTKAYKAIGLTAEEAGKIIDGWKKK